MHVICVDDEKPILENFRLTVKDLPEIKTLRLFSTGREAIKWAKNNPVDVAFLDIDMPQKSGIALAKELNEFNPNIRIIFVTAFTQYAFEAYSVKAIGYILKPYDLEEIREALELASRIRPKQVQRVVIQTMPEFSLTFQNQMIYLGGTKTSELMALLVDRAEAGLTSGDAIACLWPERNRDEKSQALYRTTFYNLMNTLKEEGVDDIIRNEGRRKFIDMEKVDCDLYKILDGDVDLLEEKYTGTYMNNYSWAEIRNAQLTEMKNEVKK